MLSVAAEAIEPVRGLHQVAGSVFGRPQWWTTRYLSAVATKVDQVAVMSYDSGLPLRFLYRGFVARQTRLALDAVPPGVDLLMGLPAFHTDDMFHRESAETVGAAIHGVRVALTSSAGWAGRSVGVALYVDFAATASDWSAYRNDWCGCG